MILQQPEWSYGPLRQIQSMQKAVQLTTFCVKSKESINVVPLKKRYSIYSICNMSSILVDIKI